MKKYRTVIELVCEAEDNAEALDLAGEYLRGAINSGVKMRCRTRPLHNAAKVVLTSFMAFGLVGAGLVSVNLAQPRQYCSSGLVGLNACQSPLKTTGEESSKAEFKADWQAEEIDRALQRIKR
jgi:hypothetical protein